MSRPVLKLKEINPLLFNFVEELVEIRVGSFWKPLLSFLSELLTQQQHRDDFGDA